MPTDDERREVARDLRGLAKNVEPWGDDSTGFLEGLDDILFQFGPNSLTDMANRLADLIEPERRVCEQCGRQYYPTARNQRYCCKQCKKDHYISERLSREGEVPEYIAKVYGLEVEDAD